MSVRAGLLLVGLIVVAAAGWFWSQHAGETVPPTPVDLPEANEPPVEEPKPESGPLLQGGEEEPSTPASEPTTADTGVGEGDILFTGSVVDVDHEPVAGAAVTAKYQGAVLRQVRSNAEGIYRFRASFDADIAEYTAGVVLARGPGGDVAYGTFPIASGAHPLAKKLSSERKIAPLMLRPGASVDVVVSSECDGGLPATVWVVNTWLMSAEPVVMDQTDADGKLTLEGIPHGQWRVIAAARGCGRDATVIQLPRPEAKIVELTLPEARILSIHVKEKGKGDPIPDAQIAVIERVRLPGSSLRSALVSQPSAYVTDKNGIAIIEGLGTKERLELRVTAEGFPVGGGAHGRVAQGAVDVAAHMEEVIVELARPRTIAWPIEDKGHGIPPDGSTVELRPFTNSGQLNIPKSGTIENGEVVVDGWAPGFASAYAYVKGHGAARLGLSKRDAEIGHPTAFYPVRKIELFAKHPDGSPAQGILLRADDGGNNPVTSAAETNGRRLRRVDRALRRSPLAGELLRRTGWRTVRGLPAGQRRPGQAGRALRVHGPRYAPAARDDPDRRPACRRGVLASSPGGQCHGAFHAGCGRWRGRGRVHAPRSQGSGGDVCALVRVSRRRPDSGAVGRTRPD